MDVNTKLTTAATAPTKPKTHVVAKKEAAPDPSETFTSGSTSEGAGLMPKATHTPKPNPNDSEVTSGEPVVGKAQPKPTYSAGPLRSPVFLPTEADYFKNALATITNAKPGDIVGIQMYEFQNAATNTDAGATKAPGYADQQALLPAIAEAAKRGVKLNLILDASKDEKTGKLNNQPIIDYLDKNASGTGNLSLDLYPPSVVNIDHAKQIFHLAKQPDGSFKVMQAMGGGSNWGNHTPANDDGGGIFYGRDAVPAINIFYRDLAFCRGDATSAVDTPIDPKAPVQWHTTSPNAEGGGSHTIKDVKLQMMQEALDSGGKYRADQFCFNQPEELALAVKLGPSMFLRDDPSEVHVNKPGMEAIRAAGGNARWANTMMNTTTMPGQKNHEKLNLLEDKNGVAQAAVFGSANDTNQGDDGTHTVTAADGTHKTDKPNHEVDASIRRVTTNEITADGTPYSTAGFLDAMQAKMIDGFNNKSSQNVPSGVFGNDPGGGAAPSF